MLSWPRLCKRYINSSFILKFHSYTGLWDTQLLDFYFMFVSGFAFLAFQCYKVWSCVCQPFVCWQKLWRCFHQSQTSPSTLTWSSKWQGRLVVVFRLFCSLFHMDGRKLNCCLGMLRPSCCVTLCLFVSFAQSILKTFCFYASGRGKLSRFSQMLSYSHLSGEERAILGFSIYIS